ncbi:hypothetical protein O5817_28310, partial [Escherichia coli]|nr:hypothetical protein [Escherichia coli]
AKLMQNAENISEYLLLRHQGLQQLKNASIPVIEIGAIRTDPIYINIGIDNVAAMFELTDMLVHPAFGSCRRMQRWFYNVTGCSFS